LILKKQKRIKNLTGQSGASKPVIDKINPPATLGAIT
jgi:hypothetical protein